MTALEAAGLELWGTRLVVLSACDTGVGEVRNGEGVYGLRRALVLAGAESQVVSLWKVNDASTKDLMVAYYRELMKGAGRAEALRQVQLRMLRDSKRRHPYFWASFIHSGEWANLDGRRQRISVAEVFPCRVAAFDRRPAFEGWWSCIHTTPRRVATIELGERQRTRRVQATARRLPKPGGT